MFSQERLVIYEQRIKPGHGMLRGPFSTGENGALIMGLD